VPFRIGVLPEQGRFEAPRSGYDRPFRQFAAIVDRLARVLIPPPADEVVVFERKAHRVDAAVANGAGRVGAMLREHFPNGPRLGRGLLLESRNVCGWRWWRRAQNRLQNPGSAQHGTGAIGIRRNRKNRRHAEESTSCGALRQIDDLGLLPIAVELHRLAHMAGQLSRRDRLPGLDQVQDAQIALENFVKEKRGLEPDVGTQFRVGLPLGEQLGVGRFVGVELADAEPLIDKSLGDLHSLLSSHEAGDQFVDYAGVLELAGGAEVEKEFVGHAARKEI
jgi:hypothetical protein